MNANSCIHYATERYIGSDNLVTSQGFAWLCEQNTIHIPNDQIPEPQDPSLDQLKSLGYLLRARTEWKKP